MSIIRANFISIESIMNMNNFQYILILFYQIKKIFYSKISFTVKYLLRFISELFTYTDILYHFIYLSILYFNNCFEIFRDLAVKLKLF